MANRVRALAHGIRADLPEIHVLPDQNRLNLLLATNSLACWLAGDRGLTRGVKRSEAGGVPQQVLVPMSIAMGSLYWPIGGSQSSLQPNNWKKLPPAESHSDQIGERCTNKRYHRGDTILLSHEGTPAEPPVKHSNPSPQQTHTDRRSSAPGEVEGWGTFLGNLFSHSYSFNNIRVVIKRAMVKKRPRPIKQ